MKKIYHICLITSCIIPNTITGPITNLTKQERLIQLTNNINFGNQNDSLKSAFFKENNQETFDLQTYKKFLLFLKFKEMIDGHSYL